MLVYLLSISIWETTETQPQPRIYLYTPGEVRSTPFERSEGPQTTQHMLLLSKL